MTSLLRGAGGESTLGPTEILGFLILHRLGGFFPWTLSFSFLSSQTFSCILVSHTLRSTPCLGLLCLRYYD